MSKTKTQKRKEIEKLIVKNLKKTPIIEGRTVTEIARNLKIPRPTAHIYLQLLEAQGLLEHFRVGRTKVYALKKRRRKARARK